jgi:integrase
MKTSLNANFVIKIIKPGRYFDGRSGLHLYVKKSSNKYWIFRFMRSGKRQDMSLGSFPSTSLAEARKKALEATAELARGINPLEAKKALKAAFIQDSRNQIKFCDFAKNYIEAKSHEWKNAKHRDQWSYTIESFANPIIGDLPLGEITTEHIVKILDPIWLNKNQTASRLRGRLERILASATTRKLREGVNPAQWKSHLDTILPRVNKDRNTKHFRALHFTQIPTFIDQLRSRDGVAAIALEFTILNCSRTGEVIGAKRDEITNGIWAIPGSRMKTGKEHRVPLTDRSKELIEIARHHDTNSDYLFSINGKPLSNMAMYSVLKRMEVNCTVHGFRSAFRDWVAETTDHSSEVAEKALAHQIPNQSEAAYRRGDLLLKRLLLMNDWLNYCNQGEISNVHVLKVA